jgi:hypothetical protein
MDRIIEHIKLVFISEKPPPSKIAFQELLIATETSAEQKEVFF